MCHESPGTENKLCLPLQKKNIEQQNQKTERSNFLLYGDIFSQRLTLVNTHVVADTIDYLEVKFFFKTNDWDGLEKWVHFANSERVYDIRLSEDGVQKEDHLNLTAGKWRVYLHGNRYENGQVIERITTDEAVIYVAPTGTLDGEPFPEMPASVTEQILARLENVEQNGGGGSGGGISQETDPTVPDWAKQPKKPTYTAEEVGAATEERVNQLAKEIVNLNTTRINVRDFGAVGDGVTDDRQAIVDAFAAALDNLPCEVYFPAGTYGISNGITVNMEYGTGGLLVRGAGRDVTTIKYLEDGYNPDVTGHATLWYAIRIWPVGMPDIKPTDEADFLHDISIADITAYDPDPIAHAWNTCKGDPSGEETHGFDLQYINRVSVTNCNIITVGDEAIDLCGCIDAIVSGNHIVGSPAAGSSGGAISIGDGCRGVVVSGNTVNGSCENEVLETQVIVAKGNTLSTKAILPDGTTYTKSTVMTADTVFPAGTVLVKHNYGIAVESSSITVSDIVVIGNTITNIHGNGVNLGATQTGAGLTNISVADNIIHRCSSGVNFSGTQPKSAIKISGNTISDCYTDTTSFGYAIYSDAGFTDITVLGNTIRNIGGDYALRLISGSSKQMIYDNLFENIAKQIFYGSGEVIIKDCVFNGVGTAAHLDAKAAIQKHNGTLTVSGCKFSDIRSNCAVQGATVVENTEIEMVNTSGTPNAGGDVLKNLSGDANSLLRVANCKFGARFIINRDNAIVQGVHITSTKIGSNAIIVNANGVLVTGCNISINSNSAIAEGAGYNGNIFANNITNRSITTVGDKTVSVNNVDLRTLTA